MSQSNGLDAHQRPPERMRSLFKKYQGCKARDLFLDAEIIDMQGEAIEPGNGLTAVPESCNADRDSAYREFLSSQSVEQDKGKAAIIPTFQVTNIPGQLFYLRSYFLSS